MTPKEPETQEHQSTQHSGAKTQTNLPLHGIKVLELSKELSASMVGMMLSDLGATVVRVYDPETEANNGKQNDEPYRAVIDRNKYCLALDIKSSYGYQQVLNLIDNSDVVMENFDPGYLKNIGIDFALLHQKYPAMLFLSIPGFASNDEDRRHWVATDAVVSASAGMYADMGYNRVLMGVNPSFSPLTLASAYGSVMATYGLLSALYHRQKTGRGDWIEVPLVASLMETLSYNSMHIENYPKRYLTPREVEIDRRKNNNIPMDMSYNDVMDLLDPFFRSYTCKDGRPFYLVSLDHKNHIRRTLQALGVEEKLASMGLETIDDMYASSKQWQTTGILNLYPVAMQWVKPVAGIIKEAFLTKTSDEWEKIFGSIGIPGAKHRTLQEWIHDKHAHDTGLIVNNKDVYYGDMMQPGPVFWEEDTADDIMTPQSRQFVDYEQALSVMSAPTTLSVDKTNTVAKVEKQGWFDGIKILDLTNVIAGPHAGFCMIRFGAEVIKLDTIKPKYGPFCSILYAINQGRGKKSILIDKDTKSGRNIFETLVKDMDIVLLNATNRQLKPLGLDKDSLKAINPSVIFCKLDCFGGPKIGERSDYIGYDDLVQVTTGIQSRFGGALTTPEEHAHIGTIDAVCGLSAAASMAMALFCHEKNQHHQRVHTSLSSLSHLLQIKYCYDYDGRGPFNEPSGRETQGHNYLSHFYQAADGWLYLDAQEQGASQLHDMFTDLVDAEDKHAYLKQIFVHKNVADWVDQLQQVGIAIAPINDIMDLRQQYRRDNNYTSGIEQGSYAFSHFSDHPSGHAVTIVDPYAIRPKNGSVQYVAPTEGYGHSTRAILKQYGYTDEDIKRFIDNGDVALSWGDEYIPS